MDDKDRDIIRKNYKFIVSNLLVDEEFLACFISDKVINVNMQQKILSKVTDSAKATEFLNILQRKGNNAFRCLIYALMETGQDHIAEKLDKNIVDEWRKNEGPQDSPSSEQPPLLRRRTSRQCSTDELDRTEAARTAEGAVDTECSIMDPKVLDVNKIKLKEHLADMPDKIYEVGSKPRGRAVLVNIEYFDNLSERQGSSMDVMNLDSLFTALHFQVDIWCSLTADQLKDKIKKEAKRDEHKEADMFVFVILSHGNEGIVYARDGQRAVGDNPAKGSLDINKDILQQFDGAKDHCPKLHRKPKLFFIQACQGHNTTMGRLQTDGDEDTELARRVREMNVADSVFEPVRLHEMSDMMVVYSTVPGYLSMRHTEFGTWFIRDLVEVFAKEAHKEDVASMITRVTAKVSNRQGQGTGNVQICRCDSIGIRKKIYLLPRYFKE